MQQSHSYRWGASSLISSQNSSLWALYTSSGCVDGAYGYADHATGGEARPDASQRLRGDGSCDGSRDGVARENKQELLGRGEQA